MAKTLILLLALTALSSAQLTPFLTGILEGLRYDKNTESHCFHSFVEANDALFRLGRPTGFYQFIFDTRVFFNNYSSALHTCDFKDLYDKVVATKSWDVVKLGKVGLIVLDNIERIGFELFTLFTAIFQGRIFSNYTGEALGTLFSILYDFTIH